MLAMLVAYDANHHVIGTLDYLVRYDERGEPLGLVDFEVIEAQGEPLRLRPDGSGGVWNVEGAIGSGTWPEWIGSRAHEFEVELDGQRLKALRHKQSGVVRVRADIEAAIAERINAASGQPADIRDLVGGPDRPLSLAADGSNRGRSHKSKRHDLPFVSASIG